MARQCAHPVWSLEKFDREVSLAITNSPDANTQAAYSSALNTYLSCCQRHDFPIKPTVQTLTYFTVYMCHYIKPVPVNSYLSGVVSGLESYFPKVRAYHLAPNVCAVLTGMKQSKAYHRQRTHALTRADFRTLCTALGNSHLHNNLLFLSQVLSGVNGLLRSGELTQPNKPSICDLQKTTLRSSAIWRPHSYGFDLITSKTDKTYEGFRIIIMECAVGPDPLFYFSKYFRSRDSIHCGKPALWIKANGTVPTYSWFVTRLKSFFPDVASQEKCQDIRCAQAE